MRWSQNLRSFKINSRFWFNRRGQAPWEAGGVETLSRAIGELERLNRSTERDFLAVGEKLMEFRSASQQLSSDMTAVVELFSAEQASNISQALSQMLEQARDMDARIEHGIGSLNVMNEVGKRLRAAFSGVTNMVAVFRSLCTLTQIETARLGGAGADLGHLAAEIRPLSESAQASGNRVLEACSRLDRETRSAIQRSSQVRAAELREMRELITGVMASLQAFEERRALARESSDRQAAQYAALGASIDDLVSSIQFHDITRQQVEHVVEALRQLEAQWRSHRRKSCPPQTRALVTLQLSQLAEAARLFGASLDHMDRDMDSISQGFETASKMVRTLIGSGEAASNAACSGVHDESFFLSMEQHFSAILEMFALCGQARDEILSAVDSLDATVAGMRVSVVEIRGTEIQIQRISTNATIRATHIGARAGALNKIAEAMQHLSLEYDGRTEEADRALDAIGSAAGGAPRCPQKAFDTEDRMMDEIRRRLGELRFSSESSATRAMHIAGLSTRLAEEIGALRQALTAGRLFAETTGRVERLLETIQAGTAELPEDPDASRHLEHLANTYTMQRQRDVHQSVVGSGAGQSIVVDDPAHSAGVTEGKAAAANDLGDNVELF